MNPHTMKLVSYNIQYCKGQDQQINPGRIAAELNGADVIALQEVDRYWPHTGMIDQVAALTERLPDYYWVYGAGVDLHIDHSGPSEQKRRQFGNMILSRSPIIYSRHHLLPKRGSVEALSIQRSAIEATIDCGSERIRFYSVHTCHLSEVTRIPQIHQLLDIHRSAVHQGSPMCGNMKVTPYDKGINHQEVAANAIVMGDFNCQPDSVEYELMVGPLSDYGGRISPMDGFVDAWTQVGHDRSDGPTSSVGDQAATLDYCFVSTGLRHHIRRCRVDTTATGSDHLPLWTEIEI